MESMMSKRHRKNESLTHPPEGITLGNISGGVGIAIGTGAQAIVTQSTGLEADQITIAFRGIEQALTAMPEGPHKESAKSAVKNLETEARKGNQADKTKAQKWIDFLAEIAPDVWEVAIDTFINPIKGMGTVFKKIAEKAKAKEKKMMWQQNN
jgi:hypothetical protein